MDGASDRGAAADAIAAPTTVAKNNNGEWKSWNSRRVECCTLFAFSTENWSRPPREVSAIFEVKCMAIQYRQRAAVREGIKSKLLGDLDNGQIPEGARRELRALEAKGGECCRRRLKYDEDNEDCSVQTVCLVINYGGRTNILCPAKYLA